MKVLKRNQIIVSVIALMLITVGYMNYTSNITHTVETGALMDSEKMAGIGDAKLVNSNNVVENNNENSSNVNQTNEDNVQNNQTGQISTENSNESNSENTVENSNQNNVSSIETAESSVNAETQNTSSNNNTQESSTSSNIENSSETQETSSNSYGTQYFVSSRLERDKMYSQMIETYQGMLESETISAEQKSISTQEITNINNKKNSIMIAENLIKNLGFEDVVIFVNGNSTSVIVKAEKLEEADIAQIQNIVCRELGVQAESIHISLK